MLTATTRDPEEVSGTVEITAAGLDALNADRLELARLERLLSDRQPPIGEVEGDDELAFDSGYDYERHMEAVRRGYRYAADLRSEYAAPEEWG